MHECIVLDLLNVTDVKYHVGERRALQWIDPTKNELEEPFDLLFHQRTVNVNRMRLETYGYLERANNVD